MAQGMTYEEALDYWPTRAEVEAELEAHGCDADDIARFFEEVPDSSHLLNGRGEPIGEVGIWAGGDVLEWLGY